MKAWSELTNEDKITAYLMGDLPEEHWEEVADLLAKDARCRALADELELTLGLLQDGLAAPALEQETLSELAQERIRTEMRFNLKRWFQAQQRPLVDVAAALMIFAVGSALFFPLLNGARDNVRKSREALDVTLMEVEPVPLEEDLEEMPDFAARPMSVPKPKASVIETPRVDELVDADSFKYNEDMGTQVSGRLYQILDNDHEIAPESGRPEPPKSPAPIVQPSRKTIRGASGGKRDLARETSNLSKQERMAVGREDRKERVANLSYVAAEDKNYFKGHAVAQVQTVASPSDTSDEPMDARRRENENKKVHAVKTLPEKTSERGVDVITGAETGPGRLEGSIAADGKLPGSSGVFGVYDTSDEKVSATDGKAGFPGVSMRVKETYQLALTSERKPEPSAPSEPASEVVTLDALMLSGELVDVEGEVSLGEDKAKDLDYGWEAKDEASIFTSVAFNPMIEVSSNAFSTFSIDVDTAAYTIARKYILAGQRPPAEAVRTEEFINYFDYHYTPPRRHAFAIHSEVHDAPFGRGQTLRVAIKGRKLGREEERPAMLTLAIDTSGSMETPDRLGLIQRSIALLVRELDPDDKISIVQYGSKANLVLEAVPASEADRIISAVNTLQVSGSTHLEEGLKLAYECAARNIQADAENRVLLLSDGMANLGSAEADVLLASVADYRKQGVFCSVFGFGLGNYNDTLLETLADKGNGVYQFVDSEAQARKSFVDDLAANLNIIASDVKIQVEFDDKAVKRYRQVGYENRQLTAQQFRDDSVDAGEVGSGQSVTALYQLELEPEHRGPLGVVRVRYYDAQLKRVVELEEPLVAYDPQAVFTPHYQVAVGVAQLAEILRGSPYAGEASFDDLLKYLWPVTQELRLDPKLRELVALVQQVKSLPSQSP